jgi:hypothetical protein
MNDAPSRSAERVPARPRADRIAPLGALLAGGFLAGALLPTLVARSPLARVGIGLAVVVGGTAMLRIACALGPPGRALRRSSRRLADLAWARYAPRAPPGPSARRWLLLANLAIALSTFALAAFAASTFEALALWAMLVFAASVSVAALLATDLLVLAILLAAERRVARAVEVAAVLALVAAVPAALIWAGQPSGAAAAGAGHEAPVLSGPYAVRSFSYGPGDDLRAAYGRDARVLTERIDLSGVGPAGWSAARTRHWGFDARQVPVSAKAWVPLGASTVPLVLLLHGTHDMRVASEDGLAYLAQALASRGLAVSTVDENFLGYGFASAGELHESDIQARAALVVAHLEAWHAMTSEPASPLRGVVDMQRVLLVGHSRGAEAIAVAASMVARGIGGGRYRIRSLAALAPTENDGPASFEASYLTIHGDLDNDVEGFLGLRSYHRLRIGRVGVGDPDDRGALKAAVLVHGANHSQFNEAWGRTDKPWPASLLEWRAHLLPAWKQRRVAATLVAAFAEATLLGSEHGRAVLRDARRLVAADAGVKVRATYQDAASEVLATFDEDADAATGTAAGSRIDAQGFERWSELDPPLRLPEHFGTRMNRAVELMWGPRARSGGAAPRLSISLAERRDRDRGAGGSLAFSVAYPAESPELEVRLVDGSGREVGVRVDEHFPLEPLRRSRLSILRILERPTAPTFLETVMLPFSAFLAREPRLDLATIRKVEFVFRSSTGTIRIDDVQFWPGAAP